MAKIIQILDVDSDGHKVRLDDGRIVHILHGTDNADVGQEYADQPVSDDGPELEALEAENAEFRATLAAAVEHINALLASEEIAKTRIAELEVDVELLKRENKSLQEQLLEAQTRPEKEKSE